MSAVDGPGSETACAGGRGPYRYDWYVVGTRKPSRWAACNKSPVGQSSKPGCCLEAAGAPLPRQPSTAPGCRWLSFRASSMTLPGLSLYLFVHSPQTPFQPHCSVCYHTGGGERHPTGLRIPGQFWGGGVIQTPNTYVRVLSYRRHTGHITQNAVV